MIHEKSEDTGGRLKVTFTASCPEDREFLHAICKLTSKWDEHIAHFNEYAEYWKKLAGIKASIGDSEEDLDK
ncbi:MAG: hypothetical protein IPM83_16345 [Ignavibacteria bacterium]|nr:hypothetical protein [Ignavibacteria bacterium]MBK9184617.1 hypothetical protein [Ignavibacteria bacterium]